MSFIKNSFAVAGKTARPPHSRGGGVARAAVAGGLVLLVSIMLGGSLDYAYAHHNESQLKYGGYKNTEHHHDCGGNYGFSHYVCDKLLDIKDVDKQIHDLEDEMGELRQKLSKLTSKAFVDSVYSDWVEIDAEKSRYSKIFEAQVRLEQNKHDRGLFKLTFTDTGSKKPASVIYSVIIADGTENRNGVFLKEADYGVGYVQFRNDLDYTDLDVCVTKANNKEIKASKHTDKLGFRNMNGECTSFEGIRFTYIPNSEHYFPNCYGLPEEKHIKCQLNTTYKHLVWIRDDLKDDKTRVQDALKKVATAKTDEAGPETWKVIQPESQVPGESRVVDVRLEQNRYDKNLFKAYFTEFNEAANVEYSMDIWRGSSAKDSEYFKLSWNGIGYVQFDYEGTVKDLRVCVSSDYEGHPIDHKYVTPVKRADDRKGECSSYGKIELGQSEQGEWRFDE